MKITFDGKTQSKVLNIGNLIKLYFIPILMCIGHGNACVQQLHLWSLCFWMPLINEELVCAQESGNPHDPYVVAYRYRRLQKGYLAEYSLY